MKNMIDEWLVYFWKLRYKKWVYKRIQIILQDIVKVLVKEYKRIQDI